MYLGSWIAFVDELHVILKKSPVLQTENLPINTNSMPRQSTSQSRAPQPNPQPTKQELMATLNRLNSIEEVNEESGVESNDKSTCERIVEIKNGRLMGSKQTVHV